jgi:hypothetical protein
MCRAGTVALDICQIDYCDLCVAAALLQAHGTQGVAKLAFCNGLFLVVLAMLFATLKTLEL